MKAVVYQGNQTLNLQEIPEPRVQEPGDALVKIVLTSICGSDLHVRDIGQQEPGKSIGHEYCGIIEDIGSEVHTLKKGDRVVGKCAYNCGHCYYCKSGQPTLCENGGVVGAFGADGAQAEYIRAPRAQYSLEKIPDSLSFEDVLFCGDILSTGFTAALQGHIRPGDTVAVFGAGPVGLCGVAASQLFGPARVLSIDLLEYRLAAARKFGAVPINASQGDAVAKIKEMTEGRGADVGIEMSGFEAGFRACMKSVRRGGRVVQIGQFTGPVPWDITERSWDTFELWIGLGNLGNIPRLMKLIENKKLDVKPLITHRLPLAKAMRAYEIFEKKLENCIKVVMEP